MHLEQCFEERKLENLIGRDRKRTIAGGCILSKNINPPRACVTNIVLAPVAEGTRF